VAQLRAATWHPVIGLWFVQNMVVARNRTVDLPSGVRTGRAGLAIRPAGVSY
jgi:hypothetical protein